MVHLGPLGFAPTVETDPQLVSPLRPPQLLGGSFF